MVWPLVGRALAVGAGALAKRALKKNAVKKIPAVKKKPVGATPKSTPEKKWVPAKQKTVPAKRKMVPVYPKMQRSRSFRDEEGRHVMDRTFKKD